VETVFFIILYGRSLTSSAPASTASTSISSAMQSSKNSDALEKFITELQGKYPDLKGINWDNWQNWTDADWQNLQKALSAQRNAETLAQFKEGIVKKWSAYDSNDWQEFNNKWNAFIVDAASDENSDTGLLWAGFIATYGCFGTSDPENGPNPDDVYCWQNYTSWTDSQWKSFRSLYNSYLDHEWKAFYETLQSKLKDYNTVDWENWRDWTDEDWQQCLIKVSSNSSSITVSPSPAPVPVSSPGNSFFGFSGWGFPRVSSIGYGSFGAASGFNSGFGGASASNTGNRGYAAWGVPGGNAQAGSGFGFPMGYGGLGAPMGYGRW
jgi:hypothetical protein